MRERPREIISLIEDDEDEVDYKKEDLAESPQDRLAKIYEMKPQEQQQRRKKNRPGEVGIVPLETSLW